MADVKVLGVGIKSFGDVLTTGNIIFVDSGHAQASDGNYGTNTEQPMATIDAAIGRCSANNGDVILVLPGHDENPTASITMDVAGVWIKGLGWGNSRPTVTFGALAAAVDMSAASCRISGIRFDLGAVAATVTNAFNITAAGCIVEDCECVAHATSQFTNFLTATDVEQVVIRKNRFVGLNGASMTSGVVVDGCDYITITDNVIQGFFSEHALDNTTPASADEVLNCVIVDNIIHNFSTTATDLIVDLDDAATGTVARNLLASEATDGFAAGFDPGNCAVLENYVWDTADQSGGLNPSASAT